MENLSAYISHPERLNRETLYELRLIVGKYPYFDVARLLMLKNLYLLHEPDFGKELRRAALYIKSRWPLFELMAGYGAPLADEAVPDDISVDRTMSLIDAFLETLPADSISLEAESAAAVDYVSAYLKNRVPDEEIPALSGQDLIDEFLAGGNEKIVLDFRGDASETETGAVPPVDDEILQENSFFTETLAGIYIKQGKYEKALEIIKRLCLEYPNKNRYFADQIRFLEKIIKHIKKE